MKIGENTCYLRLLLEQFLLLQIWKEIVALEAGNTATSRTLDLLKEAVFSMLLHVVDAEAYSYDDQVIMKNEAKSKPRLEIKHSTVAGLSFFAFVLFSA